MKLEDIFKDYGRIDLMSECISTEKTYSLRDYQSLWLSWYRGNVKKFHHYKVYNGQKNIHVRRKTLGMAKAGCEDWASLLFNEKTNITLSDAATQNILNDIFKANKFWNMANQGIEKAFALGMGAFVVRVDGLDYEQDTQQLHTDGAKVKIEFVNATKIYPFTIDDSEITECAFVTKRGRKVYITMHLINEQTGNYEIYNITADRDKSGNISYDEHKDLYVFDTQSSKKWFQILKPNIANNIEPDSPLGISVFANAIDDLETCDIIYDSFGNEYQYGRKRVYASAEALTINAEDGSTRAAFDPNDVVFYSLPQGTAIGANDKPFVQESTGELRVDAFDKGINKALDIYSKKIGLGENFYRFEGGSITTATQVISENSSTFRTVKKHEILIEELLISLIKTILYAVNKFTPQTVNEDTDITVQFDDSIIEDKTTERTRDAQEVRDGLMEPWEFRVKWYGMSEQDAKNWQTEHEAKQRSSSTLYDAYNMFGNGGKGEGVNT